MPRLSDATLAKLAKEFDDIKLVVAAQEKKKNIIKDKLLTELERRGTHLIETNGWRITRAQAESVVINYDALLKDLPPRLQKLVLVRVVDPRAVAAAVTSGVISTAVVDRHSTLKKNAPYPTVNKVG